MPVTFELANNIERSLRRRIGDLDQAAKEAALVELYRQDRLTHHELADALGLSRLETNGLLKKHNVTEDLMTVEEFQRQADALCRELGR
jgi:DNA-directed RNA polymerase specialized sigma subunit